MISVLYKYISKEINIYSRNPMFIIQAFSDTEVESS